MNIFGTSLTNPAPSANYRGESQDSRTPLQTLTYGRFKYPVMSAEAIKNGLRETFIAMGILCNRTRLTDESTLAIQNKEYPDPDKYIDNFFMGWMNAVNPTERKAIIAFLKESGRDPEKFKFKQDAILRMNLAVALEPYRYDTIFTQSPADQSPHKIEKAGKCSLLYRETVYTAYQYPFQFNLGDCEHKPEWVKLLLMAIGQLNKVAGNHARSYFEMAPASIVVRLTKQLVAGYETYCFKNVDGKHMLPEIIDGILHDDYPGKEFFLGGQIVKQMDEQTLTKLREKNTNLERSSQKLLALVGEKAYT